ncbi:uncharacterized protein CXQ87_001086 [Candidozyma duobushaemuli]|uniref:SET domain-containing protein n=1 Tax=Candidozyma duobushaemuli TaxID=1231522 RepID=A0A2V1AJR9_9ASCO|nr:uncharacterized protein CXQ87_001086 [[Candida] duobushaemulonis]PVH18169.1 hypothetical protein CXQ87_001086 [[Candida] duobushaemulonis]
MSSTSITKLDGLLAWLEDNAFWNSDLVEVGKSSIGGTGVFWKLKDQPDPIVHIIPKNSFLCNLLTDYEPADATIDLTSGMHAIVLTFLYEHALGERSPWFHYLDTFEMDEGDDYLPLCLWDKESKEALFNSECDMLNMLDSSELISFYLECVNFAKTNSSVVAIPSTLQIEGQEVNENTAELRYFAKCVQAVISRAFTVDKFHGLSLVPGADLFNHMSPVKEEDSVVPRENVHFLCDDDEDLCDRCGEVGCGHEESDDEDINELEEEDAEFDSDGNIVKDDNDADMHPNDVSDLMEDIPLSSDSESEEESMSETESIEEEEEEKEPEEIQTLSMEDIDRLENSDADTDQEEEEVSTLSLSEDEDEDNANTAKTSPGIENNDSKVELAKELSESSKCCDIVLTALPSEEHNFELFNTYGNELSNPFLLQRYGFISKGNPNTSCLLSVQMFAYLKKSKANKRIKAQMDMKLDWYENGGFDMVNDLCGDCQNDDCNDCNEQGKCNDEHCEDSACKESGGDCEDSCCGDNNGKKSCELQEPPESWQLSPKIDRSGCPTKQTTALLHLFTMPFKIFYHKLGQAPSERSMARRITKYLLEPELSKTEKTILKGWVEGRLQRYRATEASGPRAETIAYMVSEEKTLLNKALQSLD